MTLDVLLIGRWVWLDDSEEMVMPLSRVSGTPTRYAVVDEEENVRVELVTDLLRHVDTDAVFWVTTVDEARCNRERYGFEAPSNGKKPWRGKLPPVGTWIINPILGDMWVALDLPTDRIASSEPEGDIKRSSTYHRYVEWADEGLKPPPLHVFCGVESGQLLTSNRRRILAAQEADTPALRCWYSETNEAGGPAWRNAPATWGWKDRLAAHMSRICRKVEPEIA